MEGDNKPLDDFRREMQEEVRKIWERLNGISETLENMQEQRNNLR